MKARRLPALESGHEVALLAGAHEYFPALVEAIDHSRHEVRLETYIFDPQGTGAQVVEALERAARRGVSVFLVMDGVGTDGLSQIWQRRLTLAGVKWHLFLPLGRLGLLIPSRWRRLHRKLCVVDGRIAFCGGINILDDWEDANHGTLAAPRLDFAVRVTGPLVRQVHALLAQFWGRLQGAERLREADWLQAWRDLEAAHADLDRAMGAQLRLGGQRGVKAALLLRDNLRNRSGIERAYRKAIAAAREDIIIANAYFLPGRKLRQSLLLAVRRGVRVRLLLQGRYEYFMQYHASRPVYATLLKAGIEIYEYAPSFLHAKVAVIDGHWATVGSSNLDPLSLLLAREANVVIDDAGFARDLQHALVHAMEREGRAVSETAMLARPLLQRGLDALAYVSMRLALLFLGRRY